MAKAIRDADETGDYSSDIAQQAQDLYYMITGWKGALPENISYFHAAYRQEHPVQKGRSYEDRIYFPRLP